VPALQSWLVQTFVCARRVAWTMGGGQAGDAGVFSATVFAVVIHSLVWVDLLREL
jgi:hypothetical protein